MWSVTKWQQHQTKRIQIKIRNCKIQFNIKTEKQELSLEKFNQVERNLVLVSIFRQLFRVCFLFLILFHSVAPPLLNEQFQIIIFFLVTILYSTCIIFFLYLPQPKNLSTNSSMNIHLNLHYFPSRLQADIFSLGIIITSYCWSVRWYFHLTSYSYQLVRILKAKELPSGNGIYVRNLFNENMILSLKIRFSP